MSVRAAGGAELSTLIAPAYGSASLTDLMPSIGAHLGVPGSSEDVLGLSDVERYVVVLVDGLGWNLFRRNVADLGYFAGLLDGAKPITSGVPSTTATSLASLGTGLVPGQHGLVGYTSRVPSTGEILNSLTWESDLLPRVFQSKSTFFQQAARDGVAVSSVGLARFEGTGLTEAALRGADFVPFASENDHDRRIELITQSAGRGYRSVVYAYERELDHCGHGQGCGSDAWLARLVRIDAMCEKLRQALPDEVALIITGDHGMVDIPADHQIVAEDDPMLMAGVDALAGEGRFRQLYIDRDRPSAVAARWRNQLGDRAWVRTRDEAIEEGWFGPVDDQLRERWGQVLVAMRQDWAVMSERFPREYSLVGMHGSLTPDEMLVPLFQD